MNHEWPWNILGRTLCTVCNNKLLALCSKEKVKMHAYIAGSMWPSYLQNALHYIPSRATHPTLVWRFQEVANIPMQGGALTCVPSNAMALLVLIYTWVGWSLVNLKQGSAQPKLPQFWLQSVSNPQPLTHKPGTIPLCHWGCMWIQRMIYNGLHEVYTHTMRKCPLWECNMNVTPVDADEHWLLLHNSMS